MNGMPSDRAHFFFMAFKDAKFFHGTNIKDAHSLVTRRAGNEITVRRPCKGLDGVLVLMEC